MNGSIPPFLMPFMQQDDGRRSPADDAFVPPRINKAIEFLELMALKRRRQAAASDHQMEVIEPDNLCAEEEAARDSALQCLAKYFDGKLENNVWEELRLQSIKQKVEHEGQCGHGVSGGVGRMMSCPACHQSPQPDPNCSLCEGCGHLMVQPATPENVPHPIMTIMEQIFKARPQRGDEKDGDAE